MSDQNLFNSSHKPDSWLTALSSSEVSVFCNPSLSEIDRNLLPSFLDHIFMNSNPSKSNFPPLSNLHKHLSKFYCPQIFTELSKNVIVSSQISFTPFPVREEHSFSSNAQSLVPILLLLQLRLLSLLLQSSDPISFQFTSIFASGSISQSHWQMRNRSATENQIGV
jgi:hypothetical protein